MPAYWQTDQPVLDMTALVEFLNSVAEGAAGRRATADWRKIPVSPRSAPRPGRSTPGSGRCCSRLASTCAGSCSAAATPRWHGAAAPPHS
jgi:hypothetical protein